MTFRNKIHPWHDASWNSAFSGGTRTNNTLNEPKTKIGQGQDRLKLGTTSFKSIAEALDAADGKVDGKIDKSIWNAYAKQVGGNRIQYCITTENAEKAIAKYYERNENKIEIGKYFNIPTQTEGRNPITVRPPADTNPHKTKTPIPASQYEKFPKEINSTTYSGCCQVGDKDYVIDFGQIQKVRDIKTGNVTNVVRKNGKVIGLTERNKDGKVTSRIKYDESGKIASYTEYEYNSKGQCIGYIERNKDGTVKFYDREEVDKDGNITSFTRYDANGKVLARNDVRVGETTWRTTRYYDDGTTTVNEDLDGNIDKAEKEIRYDKNGNMMFYKIREGDNWVKYNPDGTPYKE